MKIETLEKQIDEALGKKKAAKPEKKKAAPKKRKARKAKKAKKSAKRPFLYADSPRSSLAKVPVGSRTRARGIRGGKRRHAGGGKKRARRTHRGRK